MSTLSETAIFLVAAVATVPLFKRLGLGAVLGYLAAGLAIGPWGFGLVKDVESILHFAELGVVFLLFVIGLELQPRRLWALRKPVFGLGGAQVALTSAILSGIGLLFGLDLTTAIVVGLGLAMSSTAFALQTLAEKNQLTTQHGRSAFSILLFQDVSVIPLLAIIPLLGAGENRSVDFFAIGQAFAVIAGVAVVGHYLTRPFFRAIAKSRVNELFTASALLVVIGTALLMEHVGLSMALGSFLAGVLLADSEFRHEIEANIEPFKGLLLGLFFIAVGMAVDVGVIFRETLLVTVLVVGLMVIKFSVLYALGRWYRNDNNAALRLGATISQGGEFAFVLFGVAVSANAMVKELADLLIVVVTLSMAVTPLLFNVVERMTATRGVETAPSYDAIENHGHPVIVAGFGRFGQIVTRVLGTLNISFTAMDRNFEQVDFVRKFGGTVYFGDASRLDLLRAAGIEDARLFVLAIDDADASIRTAEAVKRHYPKLKILARARNRQHAYQLKDIGVEFVVRETLHSSLALTTELLKELGYKDERAKSIVARFAQHDQKLFEHQRQFYRDEERIIASVKQASKELEDLFELDHQEQERNATETSPKPPGE